MTTGTGLFTLAKMLNLLGNEVRTAHDGIQAVEKAEEFRPEVILMDVGMPGLNGYEATRRIRQQAWGRSAIIIATDRLGAGRRPHPVERSGLRWASCQTGQPPRPREDAGQAPLVRADPDYSHSFIERRF